MLNCSGVSRHQALPVLRADPPSGSSVRTSTFPSSMRYSFAGEPSPDSRRRRMLRNTMVLTLPFPARIYKCHRTLLTCYTAKFRYPAGKSCIPEQKHVFETIRIKASFGSGSQSDPTRHAPSPYLRAVATTPRWRRSIAHKLVVLWQGCTFETRYLLSPLSFAGYISHEGKTRPPPECPSAHQGLRS